MSILKCIRNTKDQENKRKHMCLKSYQKHNPIRINKQTKLIHQHHSKKKNTNLTSIFSNNEAQKAQPKSLKRINSFHPSTINTNPSAVITFPKVWQQIVTINKEKTQSTKITIYYHKIHRQQFHTVKTPSQHRQQYHTVKPPSQHYNIIR